MAHKVLIADNDATQRQLIDMLLTADNYSITGCETGRETLEFLQNHTPDIVILDLKLPDISGADICDKMRRVKRLSSIPVVLTTPPKEIVDLDEDLRALLKLVRADLVIQKPIGDKNLRERVQNLLEPEEPRQVEEGKHNTLIIEQALNSLRRSNTRHLTPVPDAPYKTPGNNGELEALRAENARLQAEVTRLEARLNELSQEDVAGLKEQLVLQRDELADFREKNHALTQQLEVLQQKRKRGFFARLFS